MEQHTFSSDESYVAAQRKLTLRKMCKKGCSLRSFASKEAIDRIAEYVQMLNIDVKLGICHGVRKGEELQLFEDTLGGEWLGTEITKELCNEKKILNLDFSKPLESWIGSVDVIYSNSLDHARYPWKTLKAWISCLSEQGRLFIEWTPWHETLGSKGNFADCFAASTEELMCFLDKVGRVQGVLKIDDVSKKGESYVRQIFIVH